jgi:site-specific DNA-methyltransferase (adenine-specific)
MQTNLFNGDCKKVLKSISDNSIDSIVTDPPYELGFMGKSWDASGIAYDVEMWQECLRVLKPGGHLLSFGGSRTYHRMACAIEDAGFQIRDQIMWVYGSGFPKSLNISKSIDKAAGVSVKVGKAFKVAGEYGNRDLRDPETQGVSRDEMRHFATTAEAKEWDGWGTALKPAHEPIVLARKPLDGTVANNVLKHGVGGINIDGCRVGANGDNLDGGKKGGTDNEVFSKGLGESSGRSMKLDGRFPANFIHDGSDEVLTLFPNSTSKAGGKSGTNANPMSWIDENKDRERGGHDDSGSAARFFYCAKASKKDRNEGLDQFPEVSVGSLNMRTDSHAERNGETTAPAKNHHPTVKPTDLMRYLCRLITPPNGTVLDPFTGSGSTGKAAALEGFNFVGIEQSVEYLEIALARIKAVLK